MISQRLRIYDIYTYDEPSQKWEQTILSMPTARDSPGVLSLPSALIVAGGDGGIWAYTAAVEIFKLTRYITVVHS